MPVNEQGVQLRLGFGAPLMEQRIVLRLAGLRVEAFPSDGDASLTCAYLASLGVPAELDHVRGALFPVRYLGLLRQAPSQLRIAPQGPLATLWEIFARPPDGALPIRVSVDDVDTFNLSWVSDGRELNEPLPRAAAAALVSLEVPLAASDDTWAELLSSSFALPVIAHARVNLDGFIELRATSPRHVEMAPIPGLFRIDAARFGCPLSAAAQVQGIPGVRWEGPLPTPGPMPPAPRSSIFRGAPDGAAVEELALALHSRRAQMVVAEDTFDRRVLSLAVMVRLGALPLLVVCHPRALWLWERACRLGDLSVSLGSGSSDVTLVTYDLFDSAGIDAPVGMIFDELVVGASTQEASDRLRALDGYADAVRLACTSETPRDARAQVTAMSVLRPLEFRRDMPVAVRYPPDAARRLGEHTAFYTSLVQLPATQSSQITPAVELVDSSPQLNEAVEKAARDTRGTTAVLDLLMRAASYGLPSSLSPKLSAGVSLVRRLRASGDSVVLLTRYRESADLAAALMARENPRVLSVETAECPDLAIGVGVDVPTVPEQVDHVVLLDYPWSFSAVDSLARSSSTLKSVTLLHLYGSVDDRLALHAVGSATAPSPLAVNFLAGQ